MTDTSSPKCRMANSKKKRNRPIKITGAKIALYAGKNAKRLDVNVRLTSAEERGLYEMLHKRHGKKG